MVSPWRHPKTGMFWFRRAVPKALRLQVGALRGRPGKPAHELKRSLRTHDVTEAKARMPGAMAWADGILEAARRGGVPLTDRQAHALAGLWYRRKLDEWEANPAAANDWDHWGEGMPDDAEDVAPDREPPQWWQHQWARFLQGFAGEVDTLLELEGVTTDAASKQRLAELLVQRLSQALTQHNRRLQGDYRPDPLPNTFPAFERAAPPEEVTTRRPAVSFDALYAAWKAVAVVKPRTLADTDYALKSLAAFVGHDDAAKVTTDDVRRWRDSVKAAGATNNTWNNRLSLIRQVFLHGASDGLVQAGLTDGLRLRKSRQKSPRPYTDAEAARILLAARQEQRPSLRWAHWIMAFTGMRAGEVLQLLGGDVRQERGIWFFDVNEDDATKSVKTSQRRHVPIHPALVREGFLAYAQAIAPDAPLFPDKPLDRHGNRGGRAWNVIGKWVRDRVGITSSDTAPDHSWRHRVEDELRAAEVPEDARDAIVGHVRRTTGRQYGVRGEALSRLHRYLSGLPVPAGVFADNVTQ
ncbi:MAG: site-specific integrase [Alphaproteobacteria bacterium]|nr:site-specific integrase [Alphaproteobacteria bacterium]